MKYDKNDKHEEMKHVYMIYDFLSSNLAMKKVA